MKYTHTIVLIFSCVACATTDRAPALPIRSDSAGVEIVANLAADRQLNWSWHERFRLGGDDAGPATFYQVERHLVAADGRGHIFVLDRPEFRVVEFDGDGQFVRSYGAEGGGPGEFQRPIGIAVAAGGEVAVVDRGKGSLVRFTGNGTVLEQVPTPRAWPDFAYRGETAVIKTLTSNSQERIYFESLQMISPADTSELAGLVWPNMQPVRFESCGPGPGNFSTPLLTKELVWHSNHRRVATNTALEYEIDLFDEHGIRFLSVRREFPLLTATLELALQRAAETPIRRMRPEGECVIDPGEVAEKVGFADFVPAIRDVALEPDGTMWVLRWAFQGEPRRLDIIDSTGTYVGTLPENFPMPLGFTAAGELLLSDRDELDVERLLVARVIR